MSGNDMMKLVKEAVAEIYDESEFSGNIRCTLTVIGDVDDEFKFSDFLEWWDEKKKAECGEFENFFATTDGLDDYVKAMITKAYVRGYTDCEQK